MTQTQITKRVVKPTMDKIYQKAVAKSIEEEMNESSSDKYV